METKIIDSNPSLKNTEERFQKMLHSLVASFQIEGIHFSEEELQSMVIHVEEDLKK
ncbi:hypothetical protein KDU71_06805 [Carboxylicivirga sediminis]|uniref:Uncharacterized protein n=1 Tax=Carboxylicivirga sediminis TaxID=2006564 RepID=A0A941F2Q4_9BACT|nr:hypothetical protein [Carboxylicivirga sediminis]MBR8535262.1 hypothetical protein [Carboxylicivirga sediminis]